MASVVEELIPGFDPVALHVARRKRERVVDADVPGKSHSEQGSSSRDARQFAECIVHGRGEADHGASHKYRYGTAYMRSPKPSVVSPS